MRAVEDANLTQLLIMKPYKRAEQRRSFKKSLPSMIYHTISNSDERYGATRETKGKSHLRNRSGNERDCHQSRRSGSSDRCKANEHQYDYSSISAGLFGFSCQDGRDDRSQSQHESLEVIHPFDSASVLEEPA